jgi:hypothetical protein
MRDYIRGLLGPVGRKNGLQLAEYDGHRTCGARKVIAAGEQWCTWLSVVAETLSR